MDKFGSVIAVL